MTTLEGDLNPYRKTLMELASELVSRPLSDAEVKAIENLDSLELLGGLETALVMATHNPDSVADVLSQVVKEYG